MRKHTARCRRRPTPGPRTLNTVMHSAMRTLRPCFRVRSGTSLSTGRPARAVGPGTVGQSTGHHGSCRKLTVGERSREAPLCPAGLF
jgi:hypothetical protein